MPSMYGPSRSNYGGYGGYWGGYGRPPHPPPPPPPAPSHQQPPPPFHPPPPPFHFRPPRPPPHTLRPPPPPPPIRLPRPQTNSPPESPAQSGGQYPPERKSPPANSNRPYSSQQSQYQQNYRSRQSNGNTPARRSSEQTPFQEKESEGAGPFGVGSPLLAGRKEKDPPPPSASVPNNKRPLPVELDPDLPEELVSKFHNNSCELCDVRLNSRIQAKNHYEGKQHKKKVKNFIETQSSKEGQPPAKMPKLDSSTTKKKSEPLDVSQLYCKCCDLSFTSEQHAQQHYMGRNHQRVLHGLKPLKAGYYNKETGKWQRMAVLDRRAGIGEAHVGPRAGIGEAHVAHGPRVEDPSITSLEEWEEMPPDPRVTVERIDLNPEVNSGNGSSPDKSLDPDGVKEKGRFYCEMCNVSATSQEQLDGHLVGQRHMKAMRATAKKASTSVPGPTDSILASVIKADEVKKPKSKDFSIYRTPSVGKDERTPMIDCSDSDPLGLEGETL